jgi:putative membrane protein
VITSLALATAVAHVGPGFGFGWIFFILIPLFWIGVFALLFAFGRRRWARAGYAHGHFGPGWSAVRSAESTLAERFAQGDIDEKEYRARLEVLRANGPVPPTR